MSCKGCDHVDQFGILKKLCQLNGPSGSEGAVGQAALELIRPFVDEAFTDRLQNVIGVRRCGKQAAKKLLLDAHMDEIGFIVTGIEEGFLRFQTIGGVDARMLPAREMTVLTEPPLYGVVAVKPPHLQTADEADKTVPLKDLRIDVGLSQEEAERQIPIGTRVVYRAECFRLGTEQVCGKALDDRACIVALLRTLELLKDTELDVDLYILCSSFEETGGAGATVGAYGIMPDYCVAVDVTHGRTPDGPKGETFPLAGGPVVATGPNMSRWMTRRFEEKAKELDIPYGMEVLPGHSGTNGWELQVSREGVATAVVSLPLKYMHTPVEVAQLSDLDQLSRLLAAFVTDLGKEGAQW